MRLRAAGTGLSLAGAALLVVLLAGLLPDRTLAPPQQALPPPGPGRPAPQFDLPQLHLPTQHRTLHDWHGRVWVLSVWASWCAPCREEHPALMALARQGGVTLVGLNYKDDPRDAQEWLLKAGDPYLTTLVDRDGKLGARFGVQGVPETFVIDAAGVIQHRHAGPLTARVWADEVLPLVQRLSTQPG